MQHRVEIMAIVLIGLSLTQRLQADEVLPGPGLLEYLGNLAEDEGSYVDPLDMADFQILPPDQTDSESEEVKSRPAQRSAAQQPLSPPISSGDRP